MYFTLITLHEQRGGLAAALGSYRVPVGKITPSIEASRSPGKDFYSRISSRKEGLVGSCRRWYKIKKASHLPDPTRSYMVKPLKMQAANRLLKGLSTGSGLTFGA